MVLIKVERVHTLTGVRGSTPWFNVLGTHTLIDLRKVIEKDNSHNCVRHVIGESTLYLIKDEYIYYYHYRL